MSFNKAVLRYAALLAALAAFNVSADGAASQSGKLRGLCNEIAELTKDHENTSTITLLNAVHKQLCREGAQTFRQKTVDDYSAKNTPNITADISSNILLALLEWGNTHARKEIEHVAYNHFINPLCKSPRDRYFRETCLRHTNSTDYALAETIEDLGMYLRRDIEALPVALLQTAFKSKQQQVLTIAKQWDEFRTGKLPALKTMSGLRSQLAGESLCGSTDNGISGIYLMESLADAFEESAKYPDVEQTPAFTLLFLKAVIKDKNECLLEPMSSKLMGAADSDPAERAKRINAMISKTVSLLEDVKSKLVLIQEQAKIVDNKENSSEKRRTAAYEMLDHTASMIASFAGMYEWGGETNHALAYEIQRYSDMSVLMAKTISARYTAARRDFVRVLECVTWNNTAKKCAAWSDIRRHIDEGNLREIESTFNHIRTYIYPMMQIAQAESKEDYHAAIEQFTAPVGSSRMKSIRNSNSISMFYGGQISYERLSGDTTRAHATGLSAGAFIPVGIDISWTSNTHAWNYGAFLSVIDLGALVTTSFDTDPEGDNIDSIDKTPEFTFSRVFSPGVFYRAGFRNTPFIIGAGFSYSPELRKAHLKDGTDTMMNATRALIFGALDLVMVPF